MVGFAVVAIFLALEPAFALSGKTEVNPMRKIIGMLQDMSKELTREGELEAEIFEKAMCACEGGEKNLDTVIAESTAAIDEYTAKTKSLAAEQTQLTQEVAEHKDNIASATKELSGATMLREKESKQFSAEAADTKSNIAQLSKAIPAIEKGMGGAALVQMEGGSRFRRMIEVSKALKSDDRAGVLAFLDQGTQDQVADSVQAPQSGQILGILKSMKDEMESDLKSLTTQETTDNENFNDIKAAKSAEIKTAEESVITKEKRLGAVALELSEGTHALEDAQEELANAEKFKANMKGECERKAKERDMRAKMRSEEIAAIGDAIKILNDDDALEIFKKQTAVAMVQKQKHATYDALLQLKQHTHDKASDKVVGVHQKAVNRHLLLLSTAQKVKEEPAPGSVAESAGAATKLVMHMVNGMEAVIHDEDVNDEHKKAWCANETETAHTIEAEKNALLTQTKTELDEMNDNLATLKDEIKGLQDKINELDKMVHEASTQRKKEHQEFVDSFATSATAIRLISKAILRLEKFYSPNKVAKEVAATKAAALEKAGLSLLHKRADQPPAAAVQRIAAKLLPDDFDSLVQLHRSSESTNLVRMRQALRSGVDPVALPDTPGTYEKKESGGVMGLMNEFKEDLKVDMTEAETEEKHDAEDYVRIMKDAEETRAADTKSMRTKESEKAALEEKIVTAEALAKLTEEEIHNLELYLVQLHTECDFLERNFDLRHDGRVDEEVGLEDAKSIVTGEEPPNHRVIEERFEEEHSKEDVDEHFPEAPTAFGSHTTPEPE